jgi:glutathione S-transferase
VLKLFHNGMSTSSQKVRLCLAGKELQWDSVELELGQGEQQAD